MDSAGPNKKGTSIPPKSTMRTRRQVAAEKRKAEEELMRAEEKKRSKSLFVPRGDGSIGSRDILIGQEDPAEVKVEVKLEDLEGEEEEGQMECDGGFEGFEQILKVEENVVVIKHEVMIDESEGATAGEQLVEECVSLDEEEMIVGEEIFGEQEAIFGEEEPISGEGEAIFGEEEPISGEEEAIAGEEVAIFGEEEGIAEQNIIVEKVLPYILPLLKQRDVFRCRLVNKLWRRMVDDFLEDCLVPQHYDDQAFLEKVKSSPSQLCPIPKFRIVKYAYKFKEEESLRKFNEVMAAHAELEQSPFVGGATVTLKNVFAASARLSRATKHFLEKFGMHIRRLMIKQSGIFVDFDIFGFVDCVKQCLRYVPNLEKLKISGDRLSRLEGKTMPDIGLELCQNEMLDRMPKLDKLDTLEFQSLYVLGCHDKERRYDSFLPYLDEIFRDMMVEPDQNQLQKVSLSLDWPKYSLYFNLPNLKELSLCLDNLHCKFNEISIDAPVEKLTLLTYKDKDIDLNGIFQKFPQLRYLCLRVDTDRLITCLKKLNLPKNNVHTLEIMRIDIKMFIPLEIAYGFPMLRYLILRNLHNELTFGIDSLLDRNYDKELENGRVKIAHLICGGTSYDSNLWTSLSQLEIFTLLFQNHDSYSRSFNQSNNELICECILEKKTSTEKCPIKSIIETREGYQRYQERVSRLTKQCSESARNDNLETTSSDSNLSGQLICSRKDKTQQLWQTRSEEKEPQVLPLILPFLNQKDIFRCRQVNNQWRGMVDDFVESFVVPEHYDDQAYLKKVERCANQLCPLPKFRNVEYAYYFRSKRMLKLYHERMQANVDETGLSPFIGHSTVTLDNLFKASPSPLLGPALKDFLKGFGVHIRNLVINHTQYEDGFDVVRFVDCVKLCLHYVPNLERLKIAGYYPTKRDQSEIDKIECEVSRNELLSRLPKLSELTTLEFEFGSTHHSSFQEADQTLPYLEEIFYAMMIKPFYQTQLKSLQIVGTLTRKITLKMCNLKELTIKICTHEPKTILQGKWLEAPVEKLNLIICELGDRMDSMKTDVFNILRIFPLVRYLQIENIGFDMSCSATSSYSSTSALRCVSSITDANNIHTLELSNLENYNSISDAFFRGFPKLRFLIIRDSNYYGMIDLERESPNGPTVPENETGELKISNLFYGGTTYDTNIWELLPTLEVFTFKFRNHAHLSYGRLPPREYTSSCEQWCDCDSQNFEDPTNRCPFKNIVETRKGYQMYHERLSRLMKQIK